MCKEAWGDKLPIWDTRIKVRLWEHSDTQWPLYAPQLMTEYFLHSTLKGHKGPINCTSFIDDGRYLATGSKNFPDSN